MLPNCVLPGYGLAIVPMTYIADRQLFTATNTAAVKQLEFGVKLYISLQCIVSWYHQSSVKLVQNNTRYNLLEGEMFHYVIPCYKSFSIV